MRVPFRTDTPYCPKCGMNVGHWPGCPNEKEGEG